MMKSDRFLDLAGEESSKFSDDQHQYGMEKTDSFYINQSSMNDVRDEDFCSGVFVSQKNKKYWLRKYWIEEKTGCNCIMLFARELGIIWIKDSKYWTWQSEKSSDADTDVAELLEVCWLDVQGKFETSFLSPGTIYEVAFVVKLDESANGWGIPVNLKLVSSDGNVQERREDLQGKPRGQWMELSAGEFSTSPEKSGEIQFWLYEHGGHWKRGLSVKGAIIRPKSSE